jgi:hypothetical protein
MSLNGRHLYLLLSAAIMLTALLYLSSPAGARFLTDDAASDQTTTQPAGTTPKDPAQALQPDAIRGISATILPGEKNGVQITWEASPNSQDSAVVLRSGYPLNTPDMIEHATPIKMVASDKLKMVLDRNLAPGRYFYAIIPKTKFDQRSYVMIPGDNFTTNPITVANELTMGDSRTVASLKAVTVDDRTVLLTWEPIGNFTGEYIIFRSHIPIDTQERLSLSEPVARLIAAKSRYLDSDAGPGRHYYALACKTIDGVLYSDLKKEFNFTTDPVFVGGVIGVRMIQAKSEGSNVTITWKSGADTLNRGYYLIRTRTQPKGGKDSIAGGYIVETVQSASEKYVDRNLPEGKYYYILAPANYKDDEDFTLTRGVNVTDPAVTVHGSRKNKAGGLSDDSRSADASAPDKKGDISPDTADTSSSGKNASGNKPQPSTPDGLRELTDQEENIFSHLEEIPLNSAPIGGISRIAEPLPLDSIPEKSVPEADTKTQRTEESGRALQSDTAIAVPQPVREIDSAPIHSSAVKEPVKIERTAPDDQPRRKSDKPVRRKKPQPAITDANDKQPQSLTERGRRVDAIVKRLFEHGSYKQTVTELSRVLPSLEGRDSAKALYYIGRSCVELRRYRDAVGYFSDDDVRRYYPREADFWRDFSLQRMR